MNDLSLIERLRYSGLGASWGALCKEAADAIESQAVEIARLRALHHDCATQLRVTSAELAEHRAKYANVTREEYAAEYAMYEATKAERDALREEQETRETVDGKPVS